MAFVKVAETSEISPGKTKVFKFGEKEILIANINGTFYAVGNLCTHKKGELSKGGLEGNIVICPKHKAKFDVTTGKVISDPKVPLIHPKIEDLPTYALKVENSDILLRQD